MMQQFEIIQWNCRGLRANREEIDLIISQHSPVALCLQETKLKDGNNQTFKHHHTYYCSTDSGNGGAAVIVKNSIFHSPVTLDTNLQAVAVVLTLNNKPYTICSIYIPPSSVLKSSDLEHLYKQLPSPCILMGDFNSHNPLWGCDSLNPKGQIIERFLHKYDLVLFNNKYPTRYDDYHHTHSTIDLTICHPSVYLDFTCNVFKDRRGSDHYPVQLILNDVDPGETQQIPRWNFKRANWSQFEDLCHERITEQIFNADSDEMFLANNDKMKVLTESILLIATETIPKTSTVPKKKPKPWFDDVCKDIINQRNTAARRMKRFPTQQNVEQFRFLRAKCRRTIKQRKRSSWRQYVSSINSKTPIKKVWEQIRKITGKNTNKLLHHLQDSSGELIADKTDIANLLGNHFQRCSSSSNYSPEFQQIKQVQEHRNLF
jgi:exonuclease III